MRKVFNFNAGPAMLPEEVLLQAQAEMLDWNHTGMSVMEIGHRSEDFKLISEKSEATLRELMDIPKSYHVLFLAGGGAAQFDMVPMNLFSENKHTADYIDTGIWSKKAINEAKNYGTVNLAAQISHDGKSVIPDQEHWSLNPEAAYVHYTPNETIEGIEFQWVPKTGNVPLIADMSSMILSKPVNVSDYGLIYACAQKNLGQAGITIVIIHDDLIQDPLPGTPPLYTYKLQVENHSFYNTPPTYSWYITGLVLEWVKQQGGVAHFAALNKRKAEKIYHLIDKHHEFYINTVHPDCRSRMNIAFNLKTQELTHLFLEEAAKMGLKNLKGHRLAGGIRASIYNAMPEIAVDMLVDFMRDFAYKYG